MRAIPLSEAVENWLASRDAMPCQRSVRRLRSVPRSFTEFLGREPTTADVDAETARRWLEWRATTVGVLSIRHDSKALVTIWRWCYRQGYAGQPSTHHEIQPGCYRRYRPRDCHDAEPGEIKTTRPGRRKTRPEKPRRAPQKPLQRIIAKNPHRKAPPRPDAGWRGLLLRVFS